MGTRQKQPYQHPFCALMWTKEKHYSKTINLLEQKFGDILGQGPVYPVSDFTHYYEQEFGPDLKKQLLVFRQPVPLDHFHEIKRWSNALEYQLDTPQSEQRVINLDPGYLGPSQLVLFSTKGYSHRIYQGQGIYAEVTLLYMHGQFKKLAWSYPDYTWEPNLRFLKKMRARIVQLARNQGV